MHAILLHNPGAGNGDIAADDLLAALAEGGLSARYCSSKSPDFPAALGEPADLVVAAGGDGTVAKAVDHLRERNVPLAILPLGSANNIARSLGIEGDAIEMARRGWQPKDVRRLDLGTARGPWGSRLFVEAVGMGVLAEAAAAIHEEDVDGPQRSRRARDVLCEMLTDAQPREVKLVMDGHETQTRLLLAEVMNIASIGPRLPLAPSARPGDGLLDFVWLTPERRGDMLSWLETAEGTPPLETRRGRAFAFEWRGGGLHVDDDFPKPSTKPCMVEAAISPHSISVVMPAEFRGQLEEER